MINNKKIIAEKELKTGRIYVGAALAARIDKTASMADPRADRKIESIKQYVTHLKRI